MVLAVRMLNNSSGFNYSMTVCVENFGIRYPGLVKKRVNRIHAYANGDDDKYYYINDTEKGRCMNKIF